MRVGSGSGEEVGDEAAEVVGDGAGGFADAEAAALLVDHPEAEDGLAGGRMGVGEDGVGGEAWSMKAVAVGAGGFDVWPLGRTMEMLAPSRECRGLRT